MPPRQKCFSPKYAGPDISQMRNALGLDQKTFWKHIHVTQSGGSKYENDVTPLSCTVQVLLELAYGSEEIARQIFQDLRRWHKYKGTT